MPNYSHKEAQKSQKAQKKRLNRKGRTKTWPFQGLSCPFCAFVPFVVNPFSWLRNKVDGSAAGRGDGEDRFTPVFIVLHSAR
jgi:hypothetical protein